MRIAYLVGIALLAAALLSWIAARFAPRLFHGRLGGVEPGFERRPPRLGGLAVCLATLCAGALGGLTIPPGWMPLLPWILAMFAVGFVDDVIDLPPRLKLLAQAVICLGLSAFVSFNPLATPHGHGFDLGPLAVPFTVGWLLLIVNAFNLVDGADGLAGGLVTLLCGTIALLAFGRGRVDLAPWLAVYAGAHAGFLLLNWHPARLYMGDAGSLTAGLVLALAGILGTNPPTATVPLHTNVLLFWLPLTEMALTVGRRWIRGQPLARGDDRHIHHILTRGRVRTDRGVALLLGLATLPALAAYVSVGWRSLPVAILVVLLVASTVIGVQALGYVELRVLGDRALRFFRLSRRRSDTLVRVAESAHAIRAARSWPELQRELDRLVDGDVLCEVSLVSRAARGEDETVHTWILESVVGPYEREGYTLRARASDHGHGKIRPEDVRLYLVPAVEVALERIEGAAGPAVREEKA